MTEQEKLQRAKYYMDCLANGMNPLDGTSIPEQDVVNQVKISRCLFYVADVLRRQIELQEKKGSGMLENRSCHFISRKRNNCSMNRHRHPSRPVQLDVRSMKS